MKSRELCVADAGENMEILFMEVVFFHKCVSLDYFETELLAACFFVVVAVKYMYISNAVRLIRLVKAFWNQS